MPRIPHDDLSNRLAESVTQALLNAPTLERAAPRIIELICTELDWDLGELWQLKEDDQLHCTAYWHRGADVLEAVCASATSLAFPPGGGTPGRAWTSGRPVWVTDVTREPRLFPRARLAEKSGLSTACAVPLATSGVLLFMARHWCPPDLKALSALEGVARTVSVCAEALGEPVRPCRAPRARRGTGPGGSRRRTATTKAGLFPRAGLRTRESGPGGTQP